MFMGCLDQVIARIGYKRSPCIADQANGLTGLALTKIDVLAGQESIKVCTAYELDGKRLEVPPYDELERVTPVYETLPGWSESLDECRRLDDLPANTRKYVAAVEDAVGCKVWVIGVGPGRERTVVVRDPFG